MMIARVQTASTSSRMWVEITMILSFAIALISVAHLVLLVRIEAVGRLVEDQHLRVVQERLRQTDAALEALRQRLDDLLEHARERQARDDVVEPRAAPLAGRGRARRR